MVPNYTLRGSDEREERLLDGTRYERDLVVVARHRLGPLHGEPGRVGGDLRVEGAADEELLDLGDAPRDRCDAGEDDAGRDDLSVLRREREGDAAEGEVPRAAGTDLPGTKLPLGG